MSHYESMVGLLPAEVELFERHIGPRDRVLDLGVGAGRTTAALAERSASYVGLDYAAAMVESCRTRFPDLDFVDGDASDLAMFRDNEFDVVVFSFNGIDCIIPAEGRSRCLAEIHRVLVPGGRLILSSHRPFVLVHQSGKLRGVSPKLALARMARSGRETARLVGRFATNPGLWSGAGYCRDSTQGGTSIFASTPKKMRAEAASARLTYVEQRDHPRPGRWWNTNFTYYVFDRR